MKKEDNFMICTVAELAKYLAKSIKENTVHYPAIQECDFCTIDIEDYPESLKEFRRNPHNCESWYGIKNINTGFDDSALTLVADYYGGGCFAVTQIDTRPFETHHSFQVAETIKKLLVDTLSYPSPANSAQQLFVELHP